MKYDLMALTQSARDIEARNHRAEQYSSDCNKISTKLFFANLFIVIVAVVAIFVLDAKASEDKTNLYATTMIITSVNNGTDVVTMMTSTGHIFTFKGVEDFMEGDLVSVLMDDNGTEVITDDSIIKVEYAGYF